jgi:hypothetical protein
LRKIKVYAKRLYAQVFLPSHLFLSRLPSNF